MGLRPVVRLRGRVINVAPRGKGIVPEEARPAGGPEPRIHSAGAGYHAAPRRNGRRPDITRGVAGAPPIGSAAQLAYTCARVPGRFRQGGWRWLVSTSCSYPRTTWTHWTWACKR